MVRPTARSLGLACLLLTLTLPSTLLAGAGSLIENALGDGDLTLYLNFESPPTAAQLAEVEAAWADVGEILCDATDGQVVLRRLVMTAGAAGREEADLRISAQDCRSYAASLGLGRLGASAFICRRHRTDAMTLAHEVAHLAFGLGDQYPETDRYLGADPELGEIVCSIGPGFEQGTTDERNNTLMQPNGNLDCSIEPCVLLEVSELSVAANHDLRRGDPDGICPDPVASTTVSAVATSDPVPAPKPKLAKKAAPVPVIQPKAPPPPQPPAPAPQPPSNLVSPKKAGGDVKKPELKLQTN